MDAQAAQAHNTRSYTVVFFLLLCECSAKHDMRHILYNLTIEFGHAKQDSRLAAYGGVVLQQFEGLNFRELYGNAMVLLEKSILPIIL